MTTESSRFPAELQGHLWHTTTPLRYEGILREGGILPNPSIPDEERWKTSQGPDYYPYVRVLGGVSLFDFTDFDPAGYGEKYPLSTWREFVPYRRNHAAAIWMQIDRGKLGQAFLSGDAVLARWKQEGAYEHTIMPLIEAAHLGRLPLTAVTRVLRVDAENPIFVELP